MHRRTTWTTLPRSTNGRTCCLVSPGRSRRAEPWFSRSLPEQSELCGAVQKTDSDSWRTPLLVRCVDASPVREHTTSGNESVQNTILKTSLTTDQSVALVFSTMWEFRKTGATVCTPCVRSPFLPGNRRRRWTWFSWSDLHVLSVNFVRTCFRCFRGLLSSVVCACVCSFTTSVCSGSLCDSIVYKLLNIMFLWLCGLTLLNCDVCFQLIMGANERRSNPELWQALEVIVQRVERGY